MKKLAIITTHPIQYYAPVFKLLRKRERISIKVFYTWGVGAIDKYDPGFDKKIEWDIPLLEGYPFEWVQNVSKSPGSHHFKGVVNPGLIKQIKAWQPDALLVFGWGYHGHLKVLQHFKNKIPILFRGDSTLLDETGGIKALLKTIFLKWVYRHVDHAFYVGVNSKAYFIKYGLKENQLSFAPHAVDNNRFAAPQDAEVCLFRKELGITDDELVILFAGKLEEKKNPMQLLEAVIRVNRPGTHLLLVGNGPLEAELKLKAKNNDNIHFTSFQNQSRMPVIYQSCDLFCLPSGGPGETWGLAVNEAMACGKAILVSDRAGCAADLVYDNVNGAVFKAADINNFSEKLKHLTEDKNRLLKYGAQSRVIIKDWNFINLTKTIEDKALHETH
jgi:glycosyltransferase involved in cell wall biosynthesis